MSIPGTSMEDPEQPVHDGDPNIVPNAEEPDDDNLIETVTVGQQKMVPVAEMIKYRKESKALRRELDGLKPRLEQSERIGQQLADAQPMIEQLRNLTPQQREALATGKLPSPAGTRQDEQDQEAIQWADMNGFVTATGELDVSRARKNLDWLDERHRRTTEAAMQPLRQNTAQQQAGVMRERAKGVVDKQGRPIATAESVDEAYGMLPPELAAHPNVAMVALGTAMFIDRMKGRALPNPSTRDSFADPIYSEMAGGGRRPSALSPEERASAAKVGLTEKDLQSAATALTQGAGRRGVSLE
jgi:hypothetical protein